MHTPSNQNAVPPEKSASAVPSLRELLVGVLSVSCGWLDGQVPNELERQRIEHLCTLIETLLSGDAISLAAMESVRVQFCSCCRNVQATHGGCAGRALGYCRLLQVNDQ